MRILFVCSGNTCRSPMAAALASATLTGADLIRSAGIECGSGLPAASKAIKVMSERGLDLSGHRSKDAKYLDVDKFDIVVAMSPQIAQELTELNPKRLEIWNITDPYGGDIEIYRATADAIEAELQKLNL